jgi:orotidine-5'-phosphate decarboxylase
MALNQAKHIIEVIDGTRCTLVESGMTAERKEFLKTIIEFNSYVVKEASDEAGTWKIGVTDVVFNPTINIYKRKLHSPNGLIITPSYWLQSTDKQTEAEVNYWIQ